MRRRRLLALLAALVLAVGPLHAPARTAPGGATARLTTGTPAHESALALAAGAVVVAEIPAHPAPAPDRGAAITSGPPHVGPGWLRWAPPAVAAWAARATGGPVRAGRAPPIFA